MAKPVYDRLFPLLFFGFLCSICCSSLLFSVNIDLSKAALKEWKKKTDPELAALMADDEYAVSKICRDKDHLTVFYTIISKRDIYKKERYGINKRLWQILMLKRQELCGDTDLSEERKARELISLLEADIAHVCLELSFPEGKPDGAVLLNQAFYRMEMERCSIGHVYDDPRLFLYAKLIKSCCSPHPDVRINGDTNTFSMYGITIYNLDAAECARYMEQIKSRGRFDGRDGKFYHVGNGPAGFSYLGFDAGLLYAFLKKRKEYAENLKQADSWSIIHRKELWPRLEEAVYAGLLTMGETFGKGSGSERKKIIDALPAVLDFASYDLTERPGPYPDYIYMYKHAVKETPDIGMTLKEKLEKPLTALPGFVKPPTFIGTPFQDVLKGLGMMTETSVFMNFRDYKEFEQEVNTDHSITLDLRGKKTITVIKTVVSRLNFDFSIKNGCMYVFRKKTAETLKQKYERYDTYPVTVVLADIGYPCIDTVIHACGAHEKLINYGARVIYNIIGKKIGVSYLGSVQKEPYMDKDVIKKLIKVISEMESL